MLLTLILPEILLGKALADWGLGAARVVISPEAEVFDLLVIEGRGEGKDRA